ncbi:MAG: damage-inducible mutagenesis protein [Telmatospirillum sp.]|nr:damage-inducible mutagenesis protein [Telmatospirillum sp.]
MNNITLEQLRGQIAALEQPDRRIEAMPTGLADVDAVLPWGGLPLGALHEVLLPAGEGEDGPAVGFVTVLLGRLAARQDGPVLWVCGRDDLYAPGLAALGLPPERILMVRPARAADALRALEEGVRCRGLAAVTGDVWDMDATARRRLHLAARDSGVTALVMARHEGDGTALTRWRVEAAVTEPPPGQALRQGVGSWRWRLTLAHCRGRGSDGEGVVARWLVEWNDETHRLRLASLPGDRPVVPAVPGIRRAG